MDAKRLDYQSQIDDLRAQSQQELADFLNIEMDLGHTLVEVAKNHAERKNMEAYEQSRRHALDAMAAVDHFKDRLPAEARAKIEARASELANLIGLVRPPTHK